jgi:hypothetical protein
MAQKATISYRKVCPNCGEKPAWYIEDEYNYNEDTREITFKPVYSCGACNFHIPRKEKK